MRVCGMRTGVSLSITSADVDRLSVLVKDRNAPQKHVWRAQIVLLSAEGVGTNAIMRETGKSKTCVWRWQERFAAEGVDGLLRDKTRPSRIPKLEASVAERVVARPWRNRRTKQPIGPARQWPSKPASAPARCSASGALTGSSRIGSSSSSCPTTAPSSTSCATSSGSTSIRRRTRSSSPSTKRARWLARHPRWTFHFTPTSASWLNAVEGFFAILTKRRLKRGVFRSVADLQAAINRFLDDHNAHSKPFQWVADPDKIIAAVRRGHQALDSIH
jgi:hypothetical protein